MSEANGRQLINIRDGLDQIVEELLEKKRSGEARLTLIVLNGTIQGVRVGIERTVR